MCLYLRWFALVAYFDLGLCWFSTVVGFVFAFVCGIACNLLADYVLFGLIVVGVCCLLVVSGYVGLLVWVFTTCAVVTVCCCLF